MHCTSPRLVGFKSDGKTLSWSPKTHDKSYATFELPCGQCLSCRLRYAAQWAVRCCDEAKMHERNCFITLTYSDENLSSPKLQYEDFQLFIKRLRKRIGNDPEKRISYVVAGEYGPRTKRPHWHAIIFNYAPRDLKYMYTNENGDKLFSSKELDTLWGKNDSEKRPTEVGSVTFKSAGYVARYSAKKLDHGTEVDEFKPIFKVSSKRAVGRTWLEKYWSDVFNYGRKYSSGNEVPIPRYYEKWLKREKPEVWEKYITEVKSISVKKAQARADAEKEEFRKILHERSLRGAPLECSFSK